MQWKLSPYQKAVAAGIGGAVSFGLNLVLGDGVLDEDDVAVAIVALAQTYSVWRVRNKPKAKHTK